MALETTITEPKVEDFTPLFEHQEQTPTAFFGAKPVLHLHSPGASLSLSVADLTSQPALKPLGDHTLDIAAQQGVDTTSSEASACISGLDIWVSSAQLTLFAPQIPHGVQIPYQSIVVHAAEGDQVLLGLNLSDKNTPDEDMQFVQLRLTPSSSKKHPANGITDPEERERIDGEPDLALFHAISACQELNPDPPEEGDEDGGGGFDETAPGATGWITSENMADFMDENGQFKMPEGATVVGDEGTNGVNGLGEGAGRTRSAAEVDGEDDAEGEAKWQRTG